RKPLKLANHSGRDSIRGSRAANLKKAPSSIAQVNIRAGGVGDRVSGAVVPPDNSPDGHLRFLPLPAPLPQVHGGGVGGARGHRCPRLRIRSRYKFYRRRITWEDPAPKVR